jgi:hypothetical protein
MDRDNDQIIRRATEKANEVHLKLCDTMSDLETLGTITKESQPGKNIQDARSGMVILLKILKGEGNADPAFGLQKPSR